MEQSAPKTDALLYRQQQSPLNDRQCGLQWEALARQLERDRAELIAALAEIDATIGKEMSLVESGEYTVEQTADLLVHLQNSARALLARTAA